MPQHVCNGAQLTCSFGAAPSVLGVLPMNKMTTSKQPAANIMDNLPGTNIKPFGPCSSMSNPATAAATNAATAAAQGVFTLTPTPCAYAPAGPWKPGAPTVTLAGQLALDNTSTLNCAFAGVITIVMPGQMTETIP